MQDILFNENNLPRHREKIALMKILWAGYKEKEYLEVFCAWGDACISKKLIDPSLSKAFFMLE